MIDILELNTDYGFTNDDKVITLPCSIWGVPKGKFFYLTKDESGYGVIKKCSCCNNVQSFPLKIKYRVIKKHLDKFAFDVIRTTPKKKEDNKTTIKSRDKGEING